MISTPAPTFSDNLRVRAGHNSNEYLAISLKPITEGRPFRVYIYRYCVPGRCDTYSFQLCNRAVRYYSDDHLSLAKALKLAGEDFNRSAVVEMCVDAFNASRIESYYGREFTELLAIIAPSSQTYRAIKRICVQAQGKRDAEFETIRARHLKEQEVAS